MLKDTAREAEIEAVETPQLLQLLPTPKKKPVAFARIRTLHGLLKVALDDFEAVLALPDVVINMDVWVYPASKGRCAVCLAGSVMHQRYGIRTITNESDMGLVYGRAVERRLDALNDLRVGEVAFAWASLHLYEQNERPPPEEAFNLRDVWEKRLERFTAERVWGAWTTTARNMRRAKAHKLLGELRELQKDLKTAGL